MVPRIIHNSLRDRVGDSHYAHETHRGTCSPGERNRALADKKGIQQGKKERSKSGFLSVRLLDVWVGLLCSTKIWRCRHLARSLIHILSLQHQPVPTFRHIHVLHVQHEVLTLLRMPPPAHRRPPPPPPSFRGDFTIPLSHLTSSRLCITLVRSSGIGRL